MGENGVKSILPILFMHPQIPILLFFLIYYKREQRIGNYPPELPRQSLLFLLSPLPIGNRLNGSLWSSMKPIHYGPCRDGHLAWPITLSYLLLMKEGIKMTDDTYLEARSNETTRKLKWMLAYTKDPEIGEMVMEISELGEDERRLIRRVLRNLIDATTIYSMRVSRTPAPPPVFSGFASEENYRYSV